MGKITVLFLFLIGFPFLSLFALEIKTDFHGCIGYRIDRITTTIKAFDPPENFLLKDSLKANHIQIGYVGGDGRIEICYDFFLRGYAHFGKVYSGNYREKVELASGAETVSKASLQKGNTRDFSIGAGYFFRWDDFRLGPIFGWSYDFQRIQMHHFKTEGISDPLLNGLVYKMCWQGPWVGLEGEWIFCNFTLRPGYEYHWRNWKAKWLLDGPDVIGEAFSDRRSSHCVYGNVIFINGFYNMCGWDVGFGLKYQFWNAIRGRARPLAGSFSRVGLNNSEKDKVDRATWRSFEMQLSLGYCF